VRLDFFSVLPSALMKDSVPDEILKLRDARGDVGATDCKFGFSWFVIVC
jgi:hypothetical protein